MSTVRVEKTQNYTVMSNYHLREETMSLKAKGLLSVMLSLHPNWDYSIAGLVKISKENITAIRATLDELKEFGYLEVIKLMPNETKSGRIEYDYIVYEQPQERLKQGTENLHVENLHVENPTQLNIKNTLNTKGLNTDSLRARGKTEKQGKNDADKPGHNKDGSFNTDDFYELALKRSYESIDKKGSK